MPCLPTVIRPTSTILFLPHRLLHNNHSIVYRRICYRSSSFLSLYQLHSYLRQSRRFTRTELGTPSRIRSANNNKMSTRAGVARQKMEEDPMEAEARQRADFRKVEAKLFAKFTEAGASSVSPTALLKVPGVLVDWGFSWLGSYNPMIRNATANQNDVWLLDNTAYKSKGSSEWQAEIVACFFQRGRGDLAKATAAIADAIGLDGKAGPSQRSQKLIEHRLQPFVDAVAPARTLPIVIDAQGSGLLRHLLGPSNTSGIAVQLLEAGRSNQPDGTANQMKTDPGNSYLSQARGVTRLALPEGFGIISDIDDTIKITQTPDPIGILKTTFAEPAQFTSHMPDFYKILDEQLKKPCWFYLSASPYNLYPFLHRFIGDYYPKGTIILRDASWQTLGGLLGSLTQGVKAYKSSRIDKIHDWLPNRKFICIGDSTQMDPETYAEMYKKYPGWISAIYIRKVLDAPFMEQKNKPERFEKAFEGIPAKVWKLFVLPDELVDHISTIANESNLGVMDAFKSYSCGKDREYQQLECDRVTTDEMDNDGSDSR